MSFLGESPNLSLNSSMEEPSSAPTSPYTPAPGSPTLNELLTMFPEPPMSPSMGSPILLPSSALRERGASTSRGSTPTDEEKATILNKIKGKKKSIFGSSDRLPHADKEKRSPKTLHRERADRGSVEGLFRDASSEGEESNERTRSPSRSTDDLKWSEDANRPSSRSGSGPNSFLGASVEEGRSSSGTPEEEHARSPSKRNRSSMYFGGEQLTQLNVELGLQAVDEKVQELLVKSYLGMPLTSKEHNEITGFLKDMDSTSLTGTMEKAQKAADAIILNPPKKDSKDSKGRSFFGVVKKEKNPAVKPNKTVVEIEKQLVVNQPSSSDICLTSTGNAKAKFKFCSSITTKNYDIAFDPKEGGIKKKAFQNVWVTVTVKSSTEVNHVCYLDVENGARHYFVVRAQSEPFVFGSPVTSQEFVMDSGFSIPSVLGTMRCYLYNSGGITAESVFRIPSDDKEERSVKSELNSGKFMACRDVHVIPNLLKSWFRDLPESIVESLRLSQEQSESVEDSRGAILEMAEPKRSIVMWLINMLVDVAAEAKSNRMNSKNLGLVWAGQLLSTEHPKTSDLAAISQRLPNFLMNVIDGGKFDP